MIRKRAPLNPLAKPSKAMREAAERARVLPHHTLFDQRAMREGAMLRVYWSRQA